MNTGYPVFRTGYIFEMCRQSLKDWDKVVVILGDEFM